MKAARETPPMDDRPDLQTFDIGRIHQLLPHRYPFLMVDRIINVDGDNAAVGIKNVTANEPYFLGHFPGNPIMPGVLLRSASSRAAGAIGIASCCGQDRSGDGAV